MKQVMLFEQFILEKSPMDIELKDEMRINDIIRKSGGDKEKATKLAQSMASKITDRYKAMRRAKAASAAGRSDLADVFNARMKEL